MADVFISYSRRDSEFVHRIHDVLKTQGREVWVDFEDIPPSAEWMNEINAAIEASASVVFIISPHSAASKICQAEMTHALAHSKRIIPLLREDVDQTLLLKPICDRNWIFCRETDGFDAAIVSLSSAIDTDLDWVRVHTRLLTRAVEWDGNHRDKSFALRGSDLHSAERCLTESSKEPRLSPLQVEYILGSRRDENNRRNRLVGVAGVAVTVLMVIGTLLVLKYAEGRRTLARDFREKGITALSNSDPMRAELYLVRSLVLDDTPEAREPLLQARAKSARLLTVIPGPSGSAVIASSRDGKTFALKMNGRVSLLDLKSGYEFATFPFSEDKVIAAFSPDGRLLAVAGERSIAVRPVGAGMESGGVEFPDVRNTTSLAFDPTGRMLAVGANDGTLSLWDIRAGNPHPIFQVRTHRHQISSIAFTPDGQFLASGSWDNDVKLWSVSSAGHQTALKELRTLVGHDDAVLSLAFSPDGKLVASGGWDNRILLWDRDSGRQLRDLPGHNGGVLSLAFSDDGDRLASGSEDRSARVWLVDTGRTLLQLPGPQGNVTAVVFSGMQVPHGLAVGDSTGAIRIWDLDTIGQREELTTLYGHRRPVKSLAFNPRRAQLASGSWDRTVRLWNLNGNSATLLRDDNDPGPTDSVTMVNYSADGAHLVEASKDGTLRLWDLDIPESRVLKPVGADPPIVRDVSFSPDAKIIASGNDDGRIRVWSTADGSLVKEFEVDPGNNAPKKVLAVAFSPDGRLLATSGENKAIRLWKVADWTLVATMAGHTDEVWQVMFSPDGSLLLSASDDHTARLWDVASHQPAGKPLKHAGPVWGVDITADGRTLVTGSSDGSVHLWSLARNGAAATATSETVLQFSDDPVWVVTLSKTLEDPLLAIGGVDRVVRIVHIDRLRTMFADRAKLEQDAVGNSGLEIANIKDFPLVPAKIGVAAKSH